MQQHATSVVQPVPERRQQPIPANVAAIWGAFLYEGLLACFPDLKRGKEILRWWAQGCDELVAEVCAYLPEVWRQIEARWYLSRFCLLSGLVKCDFFLKVLPDIADARFVQRSQLGSS